MKHYNAENIELAKYGEVLNKLKQHTINSQVSLAELNLGQRAIFSFGMLTSLLFATLKV